MAQNPFQHLDPQHLQRFFWGCRIRYPMDFIYIYGSQVEYRTAMALRDGRDTVHKGFCTRLAEAQQAAERQATILGAIYEGIGVVQVMTTDGYLELARRGGDYQRSFQ